LSLEKNKDFGIFKTPQESMIELIKLLGSSDNICMFTDYNDEEIEKFALLEAFNGVLNSDLLRMFINRHDKRRVSKGRLGRSELVIVSHNLSPIGLVDFVGLTGKPSVFERIRSLISRRR